MVAPLLALRVGLAPLGLASSVGLWLGLAPAVVLLAPARLRLVIS